MDQLKDWVVKIASPLISKWVVRAVLYGLAAICAKTGLNLSEQSGWVAGFGSFVGAAGAAGLAMLIDWLHTRKDAKAVTKAAITGVDSGEKT